jgi:hypothetical protein
VDFFRVPGRPGTWFFAMVSADFCDVSGWHCSSDVHTMDGKNLRNHELQHQSSDRLLRITGFVYSQFIKRLF